MRRAAWALGAVALLLALAGCGRSDGEEFREDSLRPLQRRLDGERARVAATLRVVRPGNPRDARALREDVDAVAATVDRIAGLVPPPDARDQFDGYVRGLRGLVGELRAFPVSLRRGDPALLDAASRRIQDATGVVQQRGEQLERRLLDV
ncbi:MAG TPA: hypothetical protein VGW10_03365 [Solirubrobacteraceae bacterium]|nr:hypothetical protein [Solirubrobacteraceae bacterium]